MRKALALLLSIVLCLGLLALPALAEEEEFEIDENGVLVKYNGSGGAVTIPDGVTAIGDDAFRECQDLTSVKIPNSVTVIGNNAFYWCSNLANVTIPNSVTKIGQSAFIFCDSLTSMTIPSSVTSIAASPFPGCTGLTTLTVAADNQYYKSVDNVLFNKSGDVLICYAGGKEGSYTIPNSVKKIDHTAFYKCPGLTEVTIPDSVTEIGAGAFAYCYGLTEVTIPDSVTEIGGAAFAGCQYLADITLSNSMAVIKNRTFYTCGGLTSITIPNGVTAIEEEAFAHDYLLASVTIPDSVEVINAGAFSNCIHLRAVYYGGSESDWDAVEIGNDNDPLLNAIIHFNSGGMSGRTSDEHTIPTATQYVPYKASIPTTQTGNSFALTAGTLPTGLNLSLSGVISGIPTELGVFSFTVTESYAGGSTEHKCSLSVYSRMYADVEENNEPGYGFVETASDDGRVNDQLVSSASELKDQVMHCQGPFSQFRNLYLDGRRLVRDVEYHAEEGSTKITIYAETIGEEGGGTHTLAAEFETDEGETVYTVQNYTVYGIASTDVHVEVTGEAVIWTDAEPYIDTNSRTMTPFRVVGDALGLTIAWDSAAREASFSDGTRTIYFPIGSTAARTSEGTTVEMDTSAVIVNGRTYAPVRYLAQYFGYSVGWDAPTRTVKIG